MAKLILVAVILISFGTVLGVAGPLAKNKPVVKLKTQVSAIEISADAKSILNAETKTVIFTIDDTQKYLKNSGYFYNPDNVLTTNAKYKGDCFIDSVLSNKKDKIVFLTGCFALDLSRSWIGIYEFGKQGYKNQPQISFLIGGSGRNFVWSNDDKMITYESEDLGLSGAVETRTIDSQIGKILEKKNIPLAASENLTYRNEEYGFEFKYPNSLFLPREQREGYPLLKSFQTTNIDKGFDLPPTYLSDFEIYIRRRNANISTLEDIQNIVKKSPPNEERTGPDEKTIDGTIVYVVSYKEHFGEKEEIGRTYYFPKFFIQFFYLSIL